MHLLHKFFIEWMQLTINFMYKVTAWCQRTLMDPNPISSSYNAAAHPSISCKIPFYAHPRSNSRNGNILCCKTSLIWVYYVLKLVSWSYIDRIMLILEMIWSTKFELGTSNTSFNKRRRETKIHKWRST